MLSARLLARSAYLVKQRRTFGAMPVPQSSQAKLFAGHPATEGWESTVTWFYSASLLLIIGVMGFAPQTEIRVWAKQEAAARRAAGVEPDFGVHLQNLSIDQAQQEWDKFTQKAMIQTEVDDDDDDDDE